jgi:hypothetical protein
MMPEELATEVEVELVEKRAELVAAQRRIRELEAQFLSAAKLYADSISRTEEALKATQELAAYTPEERDLLRWHPHSAIGALRLRRQKEVTDAAYRERNQVVAALTEFAKAQGWKVGFGKDLDAESPEWSTVVFIETPKGQVSWHIHANDRNLFTLKVDPEFKWDGHSTEQKYNRLFVATLDLPKVSQ